MSADDELKTELRSLRADRNETLRRYRYRGELFTAERNRADTLAKLLSESAGCPPGTEAALAAHRAARASSTEREPEAFALAELEKTLRLALDHLEDVLSSDSDMPSDDATLDAADAFLESTRARLEGGSR